MRVVVSNKSQVVQEEIFLMSSFKTESLPLAVLLLIKQSENVCKSKASIKGLVLKA